MNAIAQSVGTSADTQRLIDSIARQLAAQSTSAQSTSGSRDPGTDFSSGSCGTQSMGDQDAQRFFGGLVSSLVSTVVPKLATTVLGMLQQRRRELGIPEQRDSAAVERDFQSIMGALLPKLLDAVPIIAGALSGRPAPRGPEEESQRFLPLLGALIPAIISAAPGIISAFNRQRGADPTPPSISSPEVAERFIGPLMQSVVPQLLQAAPSIFQSIFGGGGRGVSTTSSW